MTKDEENFMNEVSQKMAVLSYTPARVAPDPYDAVQGYARAFTDALHTHRLLPDDKNKVALGHAVQAFAKALVDSWRATGGLKVATADKTGEEKKN